MNKGWLWFLGGAVFVFLLSIGLRFFLPMGFFWSTAQWMRPHMYNNWSGFPPFWMMFGMWIFPFILIFLIVLGITVIVRLLSQTSSHKIENAKSCASCGKALSPDWKHCPYCGSPVA